MNEDESMENDINMMLRTPIGHSPNRSEGTSMDQEITRVKVINSGASTPVMTVRGDPTRMSVTSSNKSEVKDEFWDKDTVAFKGNHSSTTNQVDSEAIVTTSGASNINKMVHSEANGEAVKDTIDESPNNSGLSNNKSEVTTGPQPDSTSNTSEGLRTSLLNKNEAGS